MESKPASSAVVAMAVSRASRSPGSLATRLKSGICRPARMIGAEAMAPSAPSHAERNASVGDSRAARAAG